jgi:hypothetical protein
VPKGAFFIEKGSLSELVVSRTALKTPAVAAGTLIIPSGTMRGLARLGWSGQVAEGAAAQGPCYRRESINSQHQGTAENQNVSERIIATLTNSLSAPQMSAKNLEPKWRPKPPR